MVQRSQGVFTNKDSTLQYFKYQFFISDVQFGGPLSATVANSQKHFKNPVCRIAD